MRQDKYSKHINWLFCFLLLSLGFQYGIAQAIDSTENDLTLEKKRLLVLPARIDSSDHQSINSEITRVVSNIAINLGRFEVINRGNLQRILDEQALQLSGVVSDSVLITVGNIATAKEALVIHVANFTQKGVPPDNGDDEDRTFGEELVLAIVKGIFTKKPEKGVEQYPNNIQTQLSVNIENIDVETGQVLHAFYISTGHTGGSLGKSRAKAVEKFQREAARKLKSIYVLVSEVLKVSENELLLLLGEDVGVVPGTVFEITEADQINTYNSREVTIPGETIAFVAADDVSSEVNNSVILRKWGVVQPGYRAIEMTKPITGYQYSIRRSLNNLATSVGVLNCQKPLQRSSWGAGLYLSQFIDSYDVTTYGVGLSGQGFYRLTSNSILTFRAKFGLDIDYVWKLDDEDRYVNAIFPTLSPGLNTELFLSKDLDLVLGIGYRIGFTSEWQRPGKWVDEDSDEESSTTPAVWNDNDAAPTLDKSGLFITIGFRSYIF